MQQLEVLDWVLHDDLDGWDGRQVKEEADIGICKTDSLPCRAETNTIVEQLYVN